MKKPPFEGGFFVGNEYHTTCRSRLAGDGR